MQCTERFTLFTYITYFADTGFWETGQLQSSIHCSKQEKNLNRESGRSE